MERTASVKALKAVVTGIGAVSRLTGRGGGAVIGGKVALTLDKAALVKLAAGRSLYLVSGTNGKTTTTALLAAALGTAGPVVTNMTGANLKPGLVSALARDLESPVAVLEVDEAALVQVLADTTASVVVLLNLSRDQLDRYGEVRLAAQKWRTSLGARPEIHVVANCDDPLVVWAARAAGSVTWVSTGQRWRIDATSCPNCGGRIVWARGLGGVPRQRAAGAATAGDDWKCSCGLARPEPEIEGGGDDVVVGPRSFPVQLQLPGRCNAANAAMAVAAARMAGVDPESALAAMVGIANVAGRYREVSLGPARARLLLAKNPAGWNEILDFLAAPPAGVVVAVNARGPDGYDTSWLWDVDFERLEGRPVIAAGERALDVAVRLRYAGVPHEVCPDPLAAARRLPPGKVELVANYTAFQTVLGAVGG
ncbi:MAG TPA: MurT ligase domain-containing protein [Acidimicrobiia bacterium]|nr:MurT ligase domain-containing protein [Acidimicrobiia bacterium]HZQ77640.1 MurT ligase domain-containing protein [Acidimicrobiia bacterium]